MIGIEFYPTPIEVIETMLEHYNVKDKIVLEPSAGKGNIVNFLKEKGAKEVLTCEIDENLRKILKTFSHVIGDDFLKLSSIDISHIDAIVMNPPFSNGMEHILHAYDIIPDGGTILSLFNYDNLSNYYGKTNNFKKLIEYYGFTVELGDVFADAERETNCNIGLVVLKKPSSNYENEFEGFFMEEEISETEQYDGIMPYNFVRDIVNRYIEAVKLFDKQLLLANEMNSLTSSFFKSEVSFSVSMSDNLITKAKYKKELQKSAWLYIFSKFNMEKYITKKLKEQLNNFVEKQSEIPFTMKNIYRMLEIVIGTQKGRMDSAILDVVERLTKHYSENRYNVEGWKSNSHYMINKKFIYPYLVEESYKKEISVKYQTSELFEDLTKAMCYVLGYNYDNCQELRNSFHKYAIVDENGKIITGGNDYHRLTKNLLDKHSYAYANKGVKIIDKCEGFGKWTSWNFFEIKAFKKGTVHFMFKNEEDWAKLNIEINRIMGNPIPENL